MKNRRTIGLLAWVGILAGSMLPAGGGEVRAAGPDKAYARIELVRDRWGIPHVFSETDPGAMYGLGYAAAEERAFQMYYNLRIIQGRVAEMLGDRQFDRRGSALAHDRKMRTFGFYRAAQALAERLDPDTRALLKAYCEGVNDYVAAHRDRLHPLLARLDVKPEPWTPADCIASWWHLGQFFATDGTRELIQYRNTTQPVASRPGGRGAAPPAPSPRWLDDDAAVITRADVSDEWLARVQAFAESHGLSGATQPAGAAAGPRFSHAWVVGGKKTTTGSAVLVSDPQTPVRNPSLWHEFHVRGKTFNARGVGVPGSPAILIGFNEHVAWGATALGADQADLFRLKTDPDHPNQYSLDGRWREMEVIRESIQVKGARPVELVVRQTVFGPVVTEFAFPAPGDPQVALKRVPVCVTDRETLQAVLGMMRATDVRGLDRAVSAWQFPSANLVFGDRQGNIGYRMAAAMPARSRLDAHAGSAAVDGSRSESDWQGFIPPDLLPRVINPARGWIASANHRAIGSFYPLSLALGTGSAGHTIRSWRLYERLSARERFEPKDVLEIHLDEVNPARRDIVRAGLYLRDTLKRDLSNDALEALGRLEGWLARGAKSDLGEPGAELAGELNTFFRIMATPLAGQYGGGESGLSRFLRDLEKRLAAGPGARITREEQEFIDQALAGAWQSAGRRYGDDPEQWQRRARAQVRQRRIGYFDSLDGLGSLDPAGDLMTPDLTCVDGATIRSQGGQSYTQYVPLHDVDSALSVLPPGHSERADDPLRTSTMDLWSKGQLHPAPLSRKAVEAIAASTTVLSAPAAAAGGR